MKDSVPKRRIQVVCGVFFRQEQASFEVALFRRNDSFAEFEFPGGKIDPGESEEQALTRELQEELNLEVEILGFLGENTHDYIAVRVHLKAYWVRADDWTQLALSDHSEWRWTNSEKVADLAAADVPLLDLIFRQQARPPVVADEGRAIDHNSSGTIKSRPKA